MQGDFDYDQNNCMICIKPSATANDGKAISGGHKAWGRVESLDRKRAIYSLFFFFSCGVKLDFTVFVNDFRDSKGLPRRKAEMVSTHKKRKY